MMMAAAPRAWSEPGADGHLVAEVARQANRAHPRIAPAQVDHDVVGAVGRAVVDQHHLGRSVELVHHRRRAAGTAPRASRPRRARGPRRSSRGSTDPAQAGSTPRPGRGVGSARPAVGGPVEVRSRHVAILADRHRSRREPRALVAPPGARPAADDRPRGAGRAPALGSCLRRRTACGAPRSHELRRPSARSPTSLEALGEGARSAARHHADGRSGCGVACATATRASSTRCWPTPAPPPPTAVSASSSGPGRRRRAGDPAGRRGRFVLRPLLLPGQGAVRDAPAPVAPGGVPPAGDHHRSRSASAARWSSTPASTSRTGRS